RFVYDELHDGGSERRIIEKPVRVKAGPAGEPLPAPQKDVRRSVLLLQAAQARREAIQSADRGDYKEASQSLHAVADAIEQSGALDDELNEERDALRKQARDLESGAAYYDKYSRKSMATQAFYTMSDWHEGTQSLRTRELERAVKKPAIERKPGVTPAALMWNNHRFPLEGDLIRVGRAAQNDIVIDRRSVSRFHCQITRRDDGLALEDLSSTNGTFVNEARLNGAHVLSVGDVVRLGDEQVVFHE
ncbi:MAG: FHA domain-containing protein, partial [Chloroflexi bacterium]|nr:FHA domain-containing protein [Chloroflexota bacterium]